jgi:cardiolipin synthase
VIGWLLSHHAVSIAVGALTLLFVGVVLRQPRPTGSTLAWLLIIVFAPYIGMPLYLMFGGRKFQRRRRSKAALSLPIEAERAPPFGLRHLGIATSVESTEWLTDGVGAYERFLQEILSAKRSIRIVTFVVGNDETGRGLLEALTKRAKDGVHVHLLLDDLLRGQAPKAHLLRLREAGGKIASFMPLFHVPFRGRSNLRNHRKIAVFDGERAIVGGMNLADEYMGPAPRENRWRDLSLVLGGDVVKALDVVFSADWEFASGKSLEVVSPTTDTAGKTETPLRVVPSGPDAPSDPLYDALLTAVFRAERRFWVATPYFVPDEPLVKALLLAVRRGVDVRIVVPATSNHLLADLGAGPCLRQLRDEGATVWRLDRMLHAKAILVDDGVAIVGSANFDMRSLFLDYEVALFFTDGKNVERLAEWFDETLRLGCVAASDPGWLRSRVEWVVRLVAPLL